MVTSQLTSINSWWHQPYDGWPKSWLQINVPQPLGCWSQDFILWIAEQSCVSTKWISWAKSLFKKTLPSFSFWMIGSNLSCKNPPKHPLCNRNFNESRISNLNSALDPGAGRSWLVFPSQWTVVGFQMFRWDHLTYPFGQNEPSEKSCLARSNSEKSWPREEVT